MPRKKPGPPCTVCGRPSLARLLCATHYTRWHSHGSASITLRPADWGKRSSHPLNETFHYTRRCRQGRSPVWDDFWQFVADVGDRPESHTLRRIDNKQPWGPENFYWHKRLQGREYTLDTAEGKREYQRVWRANNPLRSKSNDLKKSFGITIADYQGMADAQGGVCAICEQEDDKFKHLAVDHCHKTGRVRGLLCHRCNRALGGLGDDIERLERAISYLKGAVAPE